MKKKHFKVKTAVDILLNNICKHEAIFFQHLVTLYICLFQHLVTLYICLFQHLVTLSHVSKALCVNEPFWRVAFGEMSYVEILLRRGRNRTKHSNSFPSLSLSFSLFSATEARFIALYYSFCFLFFHPKWIEWCTPRYNLDKFIIFKTYCSGYFTFINISFHLYLYNKRLNLHWNQFINWL